MIQTYLRNQTQIWGKVKNKSGDTSFHCPYQLRISKSLQQQVRIYIQWESQLPGRLIRSPRSPRRKEGSGALEEEIGVWKSQGGRKDKGLFFSSTFLSLSHIKHFFSLSPKLMITQQTTQFKLCTKDYITTMYPAWGQFLLPENLLANSVILKCILGEWV